MKSDSDDLSLTLTKPDIGPWTASQEKSAMAKRKCTQYQHLCVPLQSCWGLEFSAALEMDIKSAR
jgi:hypothetical protein